MSSPTSLGLPKNSDISHKRIFGIAFPIILSSLAQNLISLADTIFLGNLGEIQLGAAALAVIFYQVVYMTVFGFGVGAQIMMARRLGQGQKHAIGRIFQHALWFCLAAALLCWILYQFFGESLIFSMVHTEETGRAVLDYLNDPQTPERYIAVDPKYYKLFLPYTFYYSPMKDISELEWTFRTPYDSVPDLTSRILPFDSNQFTTIRRADEVVDRMLLASYPTCSQRIVLTEDEVMQSRVFQDNISKEVESRPSVTKLIRKKHFNFDEEAGVVIHKPNWWVTAGSGSLQFTQNAISRNWYKGGESSTSVLLNLLLTAKYNDRQRVEWENLLEIKTNVSSAPSDTCHNFLITSDVLRLYSKLGVKAFSKWYYTISTELKTQIFNSYGSNSKALKASFLAPLDWSTSIGMDYKLSKSKFNLSVFLAPLTYTMRYVGNDDVSETSYGLEEGASTKHDFGSQVQTNFQWTIIPAIKLKTRLDYLTSYKWTRVEWETNVDFIVTKFLSARFYVLARYDDSSAPTVGDNYLQCTETLGFGFNYAW